MNIKLITSIAQINRDSWNKLAGNNDPFVCHEFLSALEKSAAVSDKTGWKPQHLLVYCGDEIIAGMPLYLKSHSRGEYVFDNQWAFAYRRHGCQYYPKWLTAIPFTPCQGQRILIKEGIDELNLIRTLFEFLQKNADAYDCSSWHCLFPNKHQTNLFRTLGLSIREGVQYHWHNKNYQSFEHYLETFNSKNRKKIKRERRRINEQAIEMQCIPGTEISNKQWQVFYQFYQMTYLKRGMQAYLDLAFFEQIGQNMAEQLLMVMAIKDARYIGAALSFVGTDTLYGRYWGCAEEYSGLHFEACYYQGLEYCIANELQRFDSGAQGEHKISRGFEPVTTYSAHWIKDPEFSRAIDHFLHQEQQALQIYKQDACALLPFKKLSN